MTISAGAGCPYILAVHGDVDAKIHGKLQPVKPGMLLPADEGSVAIGDNSSIIVAFPNSPSSVIGASRRLDYKIKDGSDIDSLRDLSETTSRRLRTATDKHSKFMSTLSNILKKMSETDASITQNLK